MEKVQNIKQKEPAAVVILNRTKTVLLRVDRPLINKPWFFEPDPELDRAVITGIRVMTGEYDRTDKEILFSGQLAGFCLTMIDFQNVRRIDNAPVYSFGAFVDANGFQYPNYKRDITRTRLRIRLDKCYVLNFQDPSFPDDGTPRYIAFEFAYKPVTV